MALLYTKLQQSSSLAWWKVGRFCTRINKHPLVNSKLMSIWNPFFVVMGVFFCVGKSIKSTSVMLSDETKQSCTKLEFWEKFSYAFILDFIKKIDLTIKLFFQKSANKGRGFYSKVIFLTFALWCILPNIIHSRIVEIGKIQ